MVKMIKSQLGVPHDMFSEHTKMATALHLAYPKTEEKFNTPRTCLIRQKYAIVTNGKISLWCMLMTQGIIREQT